MLKSVSSFQKDFLHFGTVGCFWAVGCPNPGAPVFIHPVREEAGPGGPGHGVLGEVGLRGLS